jgi:hypothetical protein
MGDNQSTDTPAPGDSVIDSADENPNEAVVVWRPADRTIADWEYETDDGTTTTAAENPDHPADEQLVVVAYREKLDRDWPDWQDADPDDLYEGTAERDINQYGFPESRLESIVPGELEAEWLDGLAERLGDAGWSVTREPTELVVEQFGEQYRVTAEGTVEGEGDYRTPLANLVETVRG